MFLRFDSLKKIFRDDRGSTLIPVLALMALGLLIISLLAASLAQALTITAGNRANVQSQAAAESGILAAKNSILNSDCPNSASLSQPGPPGFSVTIWRNSGESSWVNGCPVQDTKKVRIISQGVSQTASPGIAKFGLTAIVESIFDYAIGGPLQTGPALLTYNGSAFTNYTINPIGVQRGDLLIPTGNFSCANNTFIDGSVIVMAGTATLSDACRVSGHVWAKLAVNLSGTTTVGLDVKSGSDTVTIGATSHVYGSVEAKGVLTVNGIVDGHASTASYASTATTSQIGGELLTGPGTTVVKGIIGGNTKVNGYLSIYNLSGKVRGTVYLPTISTTSLKYYKGSSTYTSTTAKSNLLSDQIVIGGILTSPAPQTPLISFSYDSMSWIHYTYSFSEWQKAGFQQEVVWPAGQCSIPDNVGAGTSTLDVFWRQLQTTQVKTVVDARACSNLTGNFTLTIKSDIALIGSKFNLGTFDISAGDATAHKFWLVVPDGVDGAIAPDCGGNSDHIYISQTVNVHDPITALTYGPCSLNMPTDSLWRGQIIAGSLTPGYQAHSVAYAPIGLPGLDLATGQPVSTYQVSLSLTSSRNRLTDGQ